MKFIELFAGIGGFRYGLERAGDFKCVWANDIDRYASAIYRYRFGNKELFEGDIRTVDPATIPDHDLIVGGFPCQSFSIAGKRGGFEDTRGTLFFEICRIARTKRTKYLFLENVKGLLSHNQGKTFETIIRTLDELGYDCEWQVLNSKNYGVPQNRERVFIIANLRGERRFQVFPIGDSIATNNEDAAREQTIANCIGANYGKGTAGNNARTLIHTAYQGEVREYSNLSPTISTPSGGGHLPMVRDDRDNRSCLRSGRTPEIGYIGQSIRRLTPVECERLQGFPDNWTKYGIINGKQVEISDSQRYKCCGNAVTTNVITEIGKRIIK